MNIVGSTSKQTCRFLALGDSYTIGENVNEGERWPVKLVKMLRMEGVAIDDPLIIAKTGWTTDELARAIDETEPQGPFDLVSLLIGVNNQYRGRSVDEYRIDFRMLLERAIAFAAGEPSHVVVLSIPDWGATPFAEGRNRDQIAAEIDLFNAINADEAYVAGVHYVDITPSTRSAQVDHSLLAADGLHPSGKLYTEWAEAVLPKAYQILRH